MISIPHLLRLADAYRDAHGLDHDKTVSNRVFGDSKKIAALRGGGDITVGRFNEAVAWFAANTPEGPAGDGMRAVLAEMQPAAVDTPTAKQEDAA